MPVGSGGMGEVYRARDTRLDRDVAVKVLPASLLADPDRLRRFEHEARAAGAVNHPNVLGVFDVGSAEGVPYLVCELLEGETLRSALREGALPPRKAVDYAAQIARGLAAAHYKGIVHRDLKPENIFVTTDGRVKVLDFGLAKLTHSGLDAGPEARTVTRDTEPGTVLGTVDYMSPEQARGETADARSDVFSFGVVLYEMLSGRRPFHRGTATETMAAILRDDPPTLSAASRDIPAGLERVLRRCLEKRSGERFESTRDLALALEAVSESPAPAPAARRRRALWWAAAGLAAVLAVSAGVAWRVRSPPPTAGIPSIAVLPLQNLSREPSQDYFADGMTEALITDLAKVGGLRVISRTSVMRYKGTSKGIPEIARELNVSAVLEGSVQQSGDRVRITAQLIDGRTDEHLWAESYDRDLKDVLALQSEVARQAARAIRVRLTPEDHVQLARTRAVDPEAHRLYLQARYLLNRRSVPEMKQAIEMLQQLVAKDPSYAQGYATLSEGYSVLDDYGGLPPEEAYPKAIEAARRALEIDPDLAEAHASLGHILLHQRRWDDAKRELRRAIELNPSLALAHRWYSNALAWTGDVDGSLREARYASALDPSSSATVLGHKLIESRRYDEAIEVLRKGAQIDPRVRGGATYFMLAWTYALQNRHEEALTAVRTLWELSPDRSSKIHLAYVHARAGRTAEARAVLAELQASASASDEPLFQQLAHVYVALGDKEKALSTIEQGFRAHPDDLLGIDGSPDMDALRDEPRFRRVVEALRSGEAIR